MRMDIILLFLIYTDVGIPLNKYHFIKNNFILFVFG